MIARQSTARDFIIGPVLDADGVAVTGGVVGDFKVSKNGAAPAALNGSTTTTHRHTGFYSISSAAGDFDTVGLVQFTIDDTVNSCGMVCFNVVEEVIFDALYAASANAWAGAAGASVVVANVTQWLGTAASTPTVAGVPNVNVKTWADLTPTKLPLAPVTSGRELVVDAAGLADANMVKVGPTGSGTAQTAGDIPAKTNNLPALPASQDDVLAVGDSVEANLVAIAAMQVDLDAFELRQRGNVLAQGTLGATGNDTTHLHLSGLAYADDVIIDSLIIIFDASASLYYSAWITDWVAATDLATVATLPFTPQASTDTYWLFSSVTNAPSSAPTVVEIANEVEQRTIAGVTLVDTVTAMAGTITTLDALDTAQDNQHSTTQVAVTNMAGKFAGITLLADWLRRVFRKDAGTAGMIAAEAEIDTGGTSTFTGTTDSLEAIRDASGGGGGGGDATLANQETIIAMLASGNIEIVSPVSATGTTVELVEGDRYDGTRCDKLTWTVAKDYTGTTIEFKVWRVNKGGESPTTMLTAAGVVASSTSIEVTITATFDSAVVYDGCPAFELLQFALVATSGGYDETITKGHCYVYQRA